MADKELTKKIIKALDPNLLLAKEQIYIPTNIESSAKSKASLNYIKEGVKTVFRAKPSYKSKSTRKERKESKKAKKQLFGKSNTQIKNIYNNNFSEMNPLINETRKKN